jgi:hypothetical protein
MVMLLFPFFSHHLSLEEFDVKLGVHGIKKQKANCFNRDGVTATYLKPFNAKLFSLFTVTVEGLK